MGKERENNEKARKASHFYYLVTFFVSAQFGRKWGGSDNTNFSDSTTFYCKMTNLPFNTFKNLQVF